MQKYFGASSQQDSEEWLSISDLMTGLMVIFLFIAIVLIRPLAEENLRIKEITETWHQNEAEIHAALVQEFSSDLEKWNAEIIRDSLLIRFKSPEVLFETGSAIIKPAFATILNDFFPRYVKVLTVFQNTIEEIRIEGHTSSLWNLETSADEAYFLNMSLSQERTRAVLQYALSLPKVRIETEWLRPRITANGLSSSRPVLDHNTREDHARSRRVEFRIRTTTRAEIMRIMAALE